MTDKKKADAKAAANKQRFIEAATEHWNTAMQPPVLERDAGGGFRAGEILYACLDAAVGKLTVSQADHVRKMFLQALRRRAVKTAGSTEA